MIYRYDSNVGNFVLERATGDTAWPHTSEPKSTGEVMGGKPVIRGTRVPVEIGLRKLGAGMTPQAIIEDHPRLTLDDIQAAQACPPHHIR